MVNGESAVAATLSRRVPFNRSHELHRSQNAHRRGWEKLSVDAKLRHDLNCELALITAVSVVTTLLRRTRLSS